jgi:hypothetical protein
MPMAVNFYVIVTLTQQGSWYGHRFLITSIIPLLVYPLAFLLKESKKRYGSKINIIWVLIAFIPLLSMLSFEGNSSNLTLTRFVNSYGVRSWGNTTYQLEVWKTLLFHPYELLIAIFKGGLLYIVYLGAHLSNSMQMLPRILAEKYPAFQLHIAIKTFIIYALPFLLHWIMLKSRMLNEVCDQRR